MRIRELHTKNKSIAQKTEGILYTKNVLNLVQLQPRSGISCSLSKL